VTLSPPLRKLALTVHLTSSVGWIGAVVAYLALGVAAVTSSDIQTVRAVWTAMDLTGWWVIVPLAIAALLTGLVMALGTRWGLFRHYWVFISLGLTLVCVVVLLLHMPTVSAMAAFAQTADAADLRVLGGDLVHPGVGLVLLLLVTGLNVYKPVGLTSYGWRKQREEHIMLRTISSRAKATREPARPQARTAPDLKTWRGRATRVAYFTFHFAEMCGAMFLGMALFIVATISLAALGNATFSEPTSIAFLAGMSLFMVAPMAAWMRIRGCDWRACGEMSAAMSLPLVAAVVLRLLGLPAVELWVSSSQHALMIVAMLAFMLYKHEEYTRNYTLSARAGRRAAELPSLAGQGSQPAARLEAR
jgi:hypothetical protein